MCSTLKRRPGSPSSFLLALLITPPWRSLEAPCVMLLDSLFPQLSVSRQLIFTVLNAKYVHPRPALLTDPFYKCNVITNVKNSCREITTTYLSAGHIESEAAGWKSGRLHCSLPRSDKSSSRSRLCWLRNYIYFPSAALRGNIPINSHKGHFYLQDKASLLFQLRSAALQGNLLAKIFLKQLKFRN